MSIGVDQYFKMTSEYAELVGKYFRHFKGGIYYVTGVSVNCDDLTPLVEYISVEPVAGMKWVRKAEEFTSPVDIGKYPDTEQYLRFELLEDYSPDPKHSPYDDDHEVIDRHSLLSRINALRASNPTKFMGKTSRYCYEFFINFIGDFPPVNAVAVREAVWMQEFETRRGNRLFSCSSCGRSITFSGDKVDLNKYPYCNCGCKMKNEGD